MSSPIRRWVDVNVENGETFMLASEAAAAVGISIQTLRRWIAEKRFTPSHWVSMKGQRVHLYATADTPRRDKREPSDIDRLRAVKDSTQVGRPRKTA